MYLKGQHRKVRFFHLIPDTDECPRTKTRGQYERVRHLYDDDSFIQSELSVEPLPTLPYYYHYYNFDSEICSHFPAPFRFVVAADKKRTSAISTSMVESKKSPHKNYGPKECSALTDSLRFINISYSKLAGREQCYEKDVPAQ